MKFIGLLMICGEDDILEQTLAINAEYVDAFYVLDGTKPNKKSKKICRSHDKCAAYTRDSQLPRPPYPDKPVDGYRQHIYEQAVADYGHDNWFLILHGDEVWTADPRSMVDPMNEGYYFLLPFFFPRAGEPWDYDRDPLEQLKWHLAPGFPEFRLFRGAHYVSYEPTQHFKTKPNGIRATTTRPEPILHYPYRAPDVQLARAQHHRATGFDPDNYDHVTHGERVYWTDGMLSEWRAKAWFRDLGYANADEFLHPVAA